MANVKGPKVKGKNRLYQGNGYNGCLTSVAVMKTWDKGWRKAFPVGPKTKKNKETVVSE